MEPKTEENKETVKPEEQPVGRLNFLVEKRSFEVIFQAIGQTLFWLVIPLLMVYLAYGLFNWHLDISNAQKGIKVYNQLFRKIMQHDSISGKDYILRDKMDSLQITLNAYCRDEQLPTVDLSNLDTGEFNSPKVYFSSLEAIGWAQADTVAGYSSLNRNKVTNYCGKIIDNYYNAGLDNYVVRGSFGTDFGIGLGAAILLLFTVSILVMGYQQYHRYLRQKENQLLQSELRKQVNTGTDASPVWELAQVVLNKYYERNLNQNKLIFYVSVTVMVAGFGLILYGLSLTYKVSQGLNPTTLSVGSGIIVQFIGATFLVMYNSTVAQSAQYTSSLQRVSTIGTSIKILDNIKPANDADQSTIKLLTEARITIAQSLITDSKV